MQKELKIEQNIEQGSTNAYADLGLENEAGPINYYVLLHRCLKRV